ncbi:MAG: hypothetical protein E7208_12440 [Clostridium butyricum]|nr:hypothetical protein [Clostridium butyricum]
MKYLFGAFAIVSIIFMCVFMFLGIWLFVVALKAFRHQRYHNYILEKIYQQLSKISDVLSSEVNKNDYSYLIGEEDFNLADDRSTDEIDNVTDFNKQEKFTK